MRLAALVLLLLSLPALADPPEDAPLVLTVTAGEVLLPDGSRRIVGPGVFQNEPAAINTANRIRYLEAREKERPTVTLVVLALVVGAAAGYGAAQVHGILRR